MSQTLPNIIRNDPWLQPHRGKIEARIDRFRDRYSALSATTGNLKEFAAGHLYFGLHRTGEGWVFREWAPNASAIFLTGVMTGWQEDPDYALKPLENGIWELHLPLTGLNQGDLYRLSMHWQGGRGDRIPAWANRVVQDPATLIFNAEVWAPDRRFRFRNPRPPAGERPPMIYEAHVGMSAEEGRIAGYGEFREHVLPRIAEAGYNAIQLMAIQEHPYYGSFGYHVSSFFAPSSRFGTPQELQELIDAAHGLELAVIMDLVHSHSVKNEVEGLAKFDGTPYQYFHDGSRREHVAWDSLCFDYGKNEVLHFLLSNCRYWLEEYGFDGFRFDGVTSMLYLDHGLSRDFTSYDMYYDGGQDEDAICYLTLANKLIKEVLPSSVTVAEEMSGMPGLAAGIDDGGMGFDYRLAMGVPDFWIRVIKERKDEDWNVSDIYRELTARRGDEKTVSYAESHDQALVGDKTIIFRLMDKEMYDSMETAGTNLIVDRGMALHKMIRLACIATCGGGYLNFMGNEFGHPEWIDFPREGNNWSYHYARRQWSLLDNEKLRYRQLALFDRDMIGLIRGSGCLDWLWTVPVAENTGDQVLAFIRKDLLFVFNFNPGKSFTDYGLVTDAGKFRVVLNSDDLKYGGRGLTDDAIIHFTQPAPQAAPRQQLMLYLPARTALVLERMPVKRVR